MVTLFYRLRRCSGVYGDKLVVCEVAHIDTDSDGVCDRAGCIEAVGFDNGENREPCDTDGLDFPMDRKSIIYSQKEEK